MLIWTCSVFSGPKPLAEAAVADDEEEDDDDVHQRYCRIKADGYICSNMTATLS